MRYSNGGLVSDESQPARTMKEVIEALPAAERRRTYGDSAVLDICWQILQIRQTVGGQTAIWSFRRANYVGVGDLGVKFDAGPSQQPFLMAVDWLGLNCDLQAVPLETSSNYLKAGGDFFAAVHAEARAGEQIREAGMNLLLMRVERAAKEAEGKEGGATVMAAFRTFNVNVAPLRIFWDGEE